MRQGKYSQSLYEQLQSILEEGKLNNLYHPILVEGKRDESTLRALGFEGEIIILNQGKNLVELADEIALKHREVILLLDWDRKGNVLTKKVRVLLTDAGVHCRLWLWRKLRELLSGHISTVEELGIFETFIKNI